MISSLADLSNTDGARVMSYTSDSSGRHIAPVTARPGARRAARLPSAFRSVRPVRRGAVFDAVDDHHSLGVIDLVDDAVYAASSRTHPRQLALQSASESVRVLEECAEHEFDDRGCGAFGEPVELSFSGTGDTQCVAGFLCAHLVR